MQPSKPPTNPASTEHWSRLGLLLCSVPRPGFEDEYEEFVREEVRRLGPPAKIVGCPEERDEADG